MLSVLYSDGRSGFRLSVLSGFRVKTFAVGSVSHFAAEFHKKIYSHSGLYKTITELHSGEEKDFSTPTYQGSSSTAMALS